LRLKIAIALWFWALCILAWDAKHLEPIIGWWDWLVVGGEFGKIGLLGYAGFLLITAEEDIETLKASNKELGTSY
jgi:hypothetical protein